MRPYSPSNKLRISSGSIILFLYAIFAGVVFGAPLGYFVNLATFPPLPPIAIGLLNGWLLKYGVKKWKVASPLFAIMCAVVMSIFSYTALHYAQYFVFRSQTQEFVRQETGIENARESDQMVDDLLFQYTGSTGFWGYLLLTADSGVSVLRITDTFGNITATGIWVWLYWFFELVVIAVITALMGKRAASEPFCQTCQDWYEFDQIGDVTDEEKTQLLQILQLGDYHQAGTLITSGNLPYPKVALYAGECSCEDDNADEVLTVTQISENFLGRLKFKDLMVGILSSEEMDNLLKITTYGED